MNICSKGFLTSVLATGALITGLHSGPTFAAFPDVSGIQGWASVSIDRQDNAPVPVDYDNDGFTDIVIGHGGGVGVRFYKNDGSGNFVFDAVPTTTLNLNYGSAPNFSDFNNDGFQDLTIQKFMNNESVLEFYANSGTGFNPVPVFQVPLSFSPVTGFSSNGTYVDYDNDGDVDFFILSRQNQLPILLRNELIETGSLSFVDAAPDTGLTTIPGTNGKKIGGVAWADVDNDGDQDLYLTQEGGGSRRRRDRGRSGRRRASGSRSSLRRDRLRE